MEFLIQTIEGKVKHDFTFTLLESIEYQNWLRDDEPFEAMYMHYNRPDQIPIGSVEFVSDYMLKHHGVIPKPRNIPLS